MERIQNKDLRSIAGKNITRRADSCSNLSFLLKGSFIDSSELTLDRYYKMITKKMKRQEDLMSKLVNDKEQLLRMYLE